MIKNNFITLLKILTIIISLILTLYRFRLRIPREIFTNVMLSLYIIYILILIINCIILLALYLKYINYKFKIKNNTFMHYNNLCREWIETSYKALMDQVASIPGIFSVFLAKITQYYIKIPIIVLQLLVFVPKILLIIALAVDILFYGCFFFSYKALYLLLFALISKAILYVSLEVNTRVLDECLSSICAKNFNTILSDIDLNTVSKNNYILSENNKQFSSIDHVFQVSNLVLYELEHLKIIKERIEPSILFDIIIRFCYIILFSYIVYYYPPIS